MAVQYDAPGMESASSIQKIVGWIHKSKSYAQAQFLPRPTQDVQHSPKFPKTGWIDFNLEDLARRVCHV
jgi:hypothetical protein